MKTSYSQFAAGLAVAASIAAVNASPGAHGPSGEHLDGQATTTASGLARLPDGSVNVPKLAQRRMAIRTVMVHDGDHPLTVELNGRTAIDPNAGGRVQAPFAGQVAPGPNGLAAVGQTVRKGQVLARLHPVSSAVERGNQQAALAELRANRDLLERRVQRLQKLEGTVPAKDIEAARAELAGTIGREKAIGASVAGAENVVATADGVIASAHVLTGQIVDARTLLYEIVDPRRLLVEAMTPDVTLAGQIGSAVLVQAPQARLHLIGGARTLRDGALPLNFRAQGEGMPLAVGQPVTVLVRLRTTVKGIALPAAALVRNQANETVVWIKSGAQRFIAQPVEATALDAATVVVTRGLSADNRVVVDGAALINQIR
ncbi:efflux RND transporter periplasmic adaptor subunit [Massilia niastensis]|uniref:efflux RND transporter periplasmic adaptor subunit n=1 Tax=Massilia niastensis TaxID=544911 RepID=UPI0003A6DA74|nr:HlyD family efflux transporter periplasmic adaptor subunit [Massilia niastensis]